MTSPEPDVLGAAASASSRSVASDAPSLGPREGLHGQWLANLQALVPHGWTVHGCPGYMWVQNAGADCGNVKAMDNGTVGGARNFSATCRLHRSCRKLLSRLQQAPPQVVNL